MRLTACARIAKALYFGDCGQKCTTKEQPLDALGGERPHEGKLYSSLRYGMERQ